MRRPLLLAALFVLCVGPVAGAPNGQRDDPPPGLVPSSLSLAQVVALHQGAAGKALISPADSSETWDVINGGLTGTQTTLRSGSDYRTTTTLGPFTSAEGSVGGRRWRQNANGITVYLHDVHQQSTISARALEHPLAPQSDVRLLGESREPAAYVLEVRPAGGRHEFVFYDKLSGLTVRRDEVVVDQRRTVTFDDYRTVNGLRVPFHVHSSDGQAFNDSDARLRQKLSPAHLEPAQFAVPPTRTTLVEFPAGAGEVALPVAIINGRIIAHLDISGKRYDFQLDSGASSIIIDRAIAKTLGLPEYGRRTGATAGTYVASQTIVPLVRFGALALHDVVMTVLPEQWHSSPGVKTVGLLGFDFLAAAVVRADYARGTVSASDPARYVAPAGAFELPARLDDGQPLVEARVNGHAGDRFILDTGADRTLLYTRFMRAHPGAFADGRAATRSLAARIAESLPMRGVGGSFHIRGVQVRSLALGPFEFANHLVDAMQAQSALEYEDQDGLIGHDVLGYFTATFDFPRERIVLERNDVRP